VIKFVSDLRQVGGFPPVSSTDKTDRHNIIEIIVESVVKHHKPNQTKPNQFFKNIV
jgi:hypothetical protein